MYMIIFAFGSRGGAQRRVRIDHVRARALESTQTKHGNTGAIGWSGAVAQ